MTWWDASKTESKTRGIFSSEKSQQHINILELKAALFGLKALCNNFYNIHTLIQIDNTLVVAAIERWKSKTRVTSSNPRVTSSNS